MEPNNQITNQQDKTLTKVTNSLDNLDKRSVDIYSILLENVYLLGFTSPSTVVLGMADKINKIFTEFDLAILEKVMTDFLSGEKVFKYQLTMVDISNGLREEGVMTKEQKESFDKTGIDWTRMSM